MSLVRVGAAGVLLLCLAAPGCGDKVTVNETEKGGSGESCRSRNDCEDGLMCLDMICTRGGGGGSGSGGGEDAAVKGDAGVIKTRSELGESCQKRADCAPPLACIENTCLEGFAPDAAVESAPPRGKRGESCEATNDCERGLSCINSTCSESEFDLEFVPKECFRVQCAETEDCCENFQPTAGYTPEQCAMMKENCETAGIFPPPLGITANDCTTYTNYCFCRTQCQEELCVAVPGLVCLVDGQCLTGAGRCVDNRCAACAADTDCASPSLPFCASGTCVQCQADDDCASSGYRCVSGACRPGCTRNEQCGLLQECQGGECVDAGCSSDRQCYFVTRDDRSRCVDGRCELPCESDAECMDTFFICVDGACRFAGCNDDEECRAVLGLANVSTTSPDRAVCREPEP